MNKTITIYAFILGILLMLPSCEKTSIEEYATAQEWVKQEQESEKPKSHGTVIETGIVDLGLSVNWAACNLSYSTNHFTTNCVEPGRDYYWSRNEISYPPQSISGSVNDNATYWLGDPWRTPTQKEVQELKDKCYITYSSHRGVGGMKITGPSGKTIFIPRNSNSFYYYWTSSYDNNRGSYIAFYFNSDDMLTFSHFSHYDVDRVAIRPVCDK